MGIKNQDLIKQSKELLEEDKSENPKVIQKYDYSIDFLSSRTKE